MFKTNILILLLIACFVAALSCNSTRYRKDRDNRMSKREKTSQHYLAKQAKEITSKNIKGKDAKFKEAEKRKAKHQADLNAINKTKSKKVQTGKFTVY